MIVSNNARTLIAEPNRYEPRVNDTVLDFAGHHDFTILPARPYSSKDKATVESAVRPSLFLLISFVMLYMELG